MGVTGGQTLTLAVPGGLAGALGVEGPIQVGEERQELKETPAQLTTKVDRHSTSQLADVQTDVQPLELVQHVYAVGQGSKRPIELGDDNVVAPPEPPGELLAGLAVAEEARAGGGGIHVPTRFAQALGCAVPGDDLPPLGDGLLHLMAGGLMYAWMTAIVRTL
jgi:hypothetical protein